MLITGSIPAILIAEYLKDSWSESQDMLLS